MNIDEKRKLLYEALNSNMRSTTRYVSNRLEGTEELLGPDDLVQAYRTLQSKLTSVEEFEALRRVVDDACESVLYGMLSMLDGNFEGFYLALTDAESMEDLHPRGKPFRDDYSDYLSIYNGHGGAMSSNSRSSDKTSIIQAANSGSLEEAIQILDENPAAANARDKAGLSPLRWAALKGHRQMVELLLARGADVDSEEGGNKTPLGWAARQGHADIAEALIASGADPEHKDLLGATPLHYATTEGQTDVVKVLIDHGVNVNSATQEGITPLHEAAQRDQLDVARLLVSAGADVNAQWESGMTVLHTAAARSKEFVRLLLDAGADAHATDFLGRTPMMLAAKEDIARLLRHE